MQGEPIGWIVLWGGSWGTHSRKSTVEPDLQQLLRFLVPLNIATVSSTSIPNTAAVSHTCGTPQNDVVHYLALQIELK